MNEPFDFEGETDLELLGGVIDDEPTPPADTPAEAPAEAPEVAEQPAEEPESPAEEDEPAPQKRDTVIPRARFDEVNAKLHAEREEANRLRAQLEAMTKPAGGDLKEIDVDALEDDFFEAVMSGDKDKAKEIRANINAEIYNRAKAASEEAVVNTLTQREIQSEFSRAVQQTVTDYPFLDSTKPDANPAAIGEVVEWRDFYISRGESPAAALQRAAAKVAPLYAARAEPEPVVPIDKRKQAAAVAAAKAAGAQPPPIEAGVGNRAVPTGDAIIGDQDKWERASQSERLRFLA